MVKKKGGATAKMNWRGESEKPKERQRKEKETRISKAIYSGAEGAAADVIGWLAGDATMATSLFLLHKRPKMKDCALKRVE